MCIEADLNQDHFSVTHIQHFFFFFSIRGHSTTTWTEFCHLLTPPLRGQFFYSEHGQKQTFFDPLPPSSCPRSYWMVPYPPCKTMDWTLLSFHLHTHLSSVHPRTKKENYFFLLSMSPYIKQEIYETFPYWSRVTASYTV